MARSKYDETKLVLVEGWAHDGLTEAQIAKNLGVSLSTLKTWKDLHPAFLAAIQKGKEVADYAVENALFKRAVGYKYVEVTEEPSPDGTLIVTKRVTKEVAPDVTAQAIWLNNRKPKQWRKNRDMQAIDAPEQQDNGFVAALNAAAPDAWPEDEEGPADGDAPGE